MSFANKGPLCKLLGIKYPLIQAGMVWVSGAKLAAASANAGILGVIGAGSMKPDLLKQHLQKAKALLRPDCQGKLAVNVPLLYHGVEEQLNIALSEGISIFITSAGSPKLFTKKLKDQGAIVIHVTATPELALKCQSAGVDAVVCEGFEAGGHNGRDEITSLCLIPQVVRAVTIPIIAAGGFASGQSVAAAFCLGAHAVQMGTRFLATQESSAHLNFKQAVVSARFDDTFLAMKKLVPVRLLKNDFFQQVQAVENRCGNNEELETLLGKGRAKLGMLDGDLKQGELEVGQIVGLIDDLPTVTQLVQRIEAEYTQAIQSLKSQT